MEKAGVIKKALSPWAANLVPIFRRSETTGEIRFRLAIDLRHVNAVCHVSQQPLPNAERETLNLKNQTILSQLDFKAAFYSMKLSEKAQQITSIRVENQSYSFLRTPFGYNSAPQNYAFLVRQLLSGLNEYSVFCYLDDIALGSQSVDEHIILLEKFLQTVRSAGLRLNADKCRIFTNTLNLCGFTLKDGKMHLTEARKSAILKLQYPSTIRQLHKVPGFINYVKHFAADMQHYLRPFYRMLKKAVSCKTHQNYVTCLKG